MNKIQSSEHPFDSQRLNGLIEEINSVFSKMANLHSRVSLLLLFSIFFVIINCESEKKPEDKLNVPQENKDFNSFESSGKSYPYMEPNFFQKIGSHIAKGWHGFRGLFGRRSNRREENIYKNGAYEGKEEYQQPEKESTNKEYPEFGNNNYGNGFSGESQGQEQGNQKGNQEEIGFINERQKEDSNQGPKDDKKFGYEEFPGNPGKTSEIKNGEIKKLDERKPSKPENDNYDAVSGKQNAPNGKQRKTRAAFRGPRLPIRGPFRQPYRRPIIPFRKPGGAFDRFRG